MRVAFVSRRFWPAISGMSVYASNLLRELVALGHDVTMVSQYRGDEAGTAVYGGGPPPPVPGVRVVGLEAVGEQDGGDFERDVDAMVEAVVTEHAADPFDVVHAQYGYPNGWAALLASRRLGVPNVVSIQGGDGHWVGSCCETHRVAMTTVLDHAGVVLIGARSFADEVTARLGTDPERFTIVAGGVDTGRFAPAVGWAPGRLSEPPVLLYHGRVDARKGVLDLLDAVATLVEGGRRLRVVVSGIGPDSSLVEERLAPMRLDGVVQLTGYVGYDEAPEVYRRGDVFVSPTHAEGFSNTILEAMASGLAVVSCAAVGVVDCLRDGQNGLLVPPGDVSALAGALERVLDDGELRARLATAALEEVRARYAWPVVASAIGSAYRSVEGSAPDLDWSPDLPVDPTCRFRAAPHLL